MKPKLQKWRLALLGSGLLAALAIVLEPNWPAKLGVLCLQGRGLKNMEEWEAIVWQQAFEQNMAQRFGISAPQFAGRIAFIHPEGRVFERLQDLRAELNSDDFAKAELPQSFLDYTSPKIILSNWRVDSWGEIPNLNYNYINISNINIAPSAKITVSTQPLDSTLLVALAPNSGVASLQIADQIWSVSPLQALGQEAGLWPWTSSSLEFKTAQGQVLDSLDLPRPPSHSLAFVTQDHLVPELVSALKKYKTHRPQKLVLTSYARMNQIPKDAAAWIFWDDHPQATEELPTGLPLLLQTSALCPQSILHAGRDWPVDRLPRRAFVEAKDLLVGTQGLPLVRWLNRRENRMAWNLPSNISMDEQFWTLLLQTTFPQTPQIWTREETKPSVDFGLSQRQGLSAMTKLLLAIGMSLLWYWAWRWDRAS